MKLWQSIAPVLRPIGAAVLRFHMRFCNPMAPHYPELVVRAGRMETPL